MIRRMVVADGINFGVLYKLKCNLVAWLNEKVLESTTLLNKLKIDIYMTLL